MTSAEISEIWQVSERSVRNYCAQGRVPKAILEGKTWLIPEAAEKPHRQIRHTKPNAKETLLHLLKREKDSSIKGGLYHKLQIELTYNSNHIEGSRLTHEQTRFIFETKTISNTEKPVKIDDIIETVNHFRCVDLVIDGAHTKLTESFIKQLHFVLKSGTSDSQKTWFKVGDYKLLPNEVGGMETTEPGKVKSAIKELLDNYNSKQSVTFDDILDFHVKFERIHPFQDGNGRIGRLLVLKECLNHNIVPFIITEDLKMYYYRGLMEWNHERGFLRDTCLTGQDMVREWMKYFVIEG